MCTKSKKVLLSLFLAFSIISPAYSMDNKIDDLSKMTLEEMLNMNIETNIGTNLKGLSKKDTPASVYTITKEDIKMTGARWLGEALSILVPGFMEIVDEDDYIYGFRGLVQDNNSTVVLLVNGQDIGLTYNQGLSAQSNLLDLNHIERVEVITGPGSAEFGTGPLIGVINVVTDDFSNKQKSYAELGAAYGTGNYNSGYFKGHFEDDDFKFTMSASTFGQPDGFLPLKGNAKWKIPDDVIKDNKYKEQLPGYGIFGLGNFKGADFSFFASRDLFDPYTVGSRTIQTFETQGASLKKPFDISFLTESFTKGSLAITPSVHVKRTGLIERWQLDKPNIFGLGGEQNIGGKLVSQYSDENLKIALGADFDYFMYGPNPFWNMNFQSTDGFPSLASQDLSKIVEGKDIPAYIPEWGNINALDFGVFSEAYYRFLENHAVLVSGRFSSIGIFNEKRFTPRISYLGEKSFGDFGDLSWKVFYTNAFRTPLAANNSQLPAGSWFRHYNDPKIKTQEIDDFEAHVTYGTKTLRGELRAFYALNRNVIQGGGVDLASKDPNVIKNFWWTFVNSGNIDSTGLEFILNSFLLDNKLKMELSHAFVAVARMDLSIDQDLFVSTKNRSFLNYPQNVSRFNVNYSPLDNLSLRADFLLDYGRFQGDPLFSQAASSAATAKTANNQFTDMWFNLNLGAVYRVIDNVELTAHVYNVLDSRPYWPVVFKNELSYTAPPRSFKLGANYTF